MRIRRPKFLRRSLTAAAAGLLFALLSLPPMGLDFGRVYGSANSSVHAYRFHDCYLVARVPSVTDMVPNTALAADSPHANLRWVMDEKLLVFRFLVAARHHAELGPSWNEHSPPWYGLRVVSWYGTTALIIEPRKLRWFTLVLTAPLALGLLRVRARRMRQRRGACMHCGYSLFGCPSPRCPECGHTVVPITATDAPAASKPMDPDSPESP